MKKIRIIAILAAIVTAVLVYVFLSNLNKPNVIELTSVVTAKYDITKDVTISEEMLSVVELPSEAVHPSAAQKISEVVGKVANSAIVQNEQIIVAKLVEPGESIDSLAYAIEDGQRAFTVAVDEVSGVAGLVQPQDFVDVLLILTVEEIEEAPPGEVDGEPYFGGTVGTGVEEIVDTETGGVENIYIVWKTYSAELLQNIKVLAVGKQLDIESTEEKEESEYSTVTLSVSPEQAIQLNLAVASGDVRLILRSPLNSEIIELDVITVDDLVEDLVGSDTNDSEKQQ